MGLYRKGKTHIIAKFHRTDLVIFSHSKEGKTLFYSRINMVQRVMQRKFMIYGYTAMFSANFSKGDNFCELLVALDMGRLDKFIHSSGLPFSSSASKDPVSCNMFNTLKIPIVL